MTDQMTTLPPGYAQRREARRNQSSWLLLGFVVVLGAVFATLEIAPENS